jgi:hypothetical protein
MANSSKRKRRLWDAYAFPGFRPQSAVRGIFVDPKARIITLKRGSKKRRAAVAVEYTADGTTDARGWFAISRVATGASFWRSRYVVCSATVAGT